MLITKNVSHNVVRPEWAVILRPFFTAFGLDKGKELVYNIHKK